ncbi:MAG: M48 family metallopeptidase [Casimicrobiaceae bacterium]
MAHALRPSTLEAVEREAFGIAYRLRRAARRTISLKITRKGLEVSAPRWTSEAEIERLILARRQWILDTSAAAEARFREFVDLRPNGHIVWNGRRLPIEVSGGGYDAVSFGNTLCEVTSRSGEVPIATLEAEMLRIARALLPARARALAARGGITIREVTVGTAQTLWGTCSFDGRLRLNRRLMMLPPELAEHVIAHELAHRIEFNHSKRFWAALARLDPRWRQHHEEVKRYNVLLEPFQGRAGATLLR